jgi:hypothetical protein
MAIAKKSAGKKYGAGAAKSVAREMKAMKQGKLKSGSGQKVTNPKQAIAIGLSEAREAGVKVPPAPKKVAKKVAAKKAAATKSSSE